MKKIEGIILDWAGTTVDFGCFAPLGAFLKVFREWGIEITPTQAREPMGMLKIDHIKAILTMPEVNRQFTKIQGRDWTHEDVVAMNKVFEKHLFASLSEYTDPIPGVLPTIEQFRKDGLKIGSTTGYTARMMEVVRPAAEAKGYRVDHLVTPDGLPAGRPAPYMIYRNMIELALDDPRAVVKAGDTIADIREGVRAGVWSVGIVTGSSELGLTEQEYNAMTAEELFPLKEKVRERMAAAGAHFVIDRFADLPGCIRDIEKHLNA